MSCKRSPRAAVGWSAVCNCGISWSYSFAFLEIGFFPESWDDGYIVPLHTNYRGIIC